MLHSSHLITKLIQNN